MFSSSAVPMELLPGRDLSKQDTRFRFINKKGGKEKFQRGRRPDFGKKSTAWSKKGGRMLLEKGK